MSLNGSQASADRMGIVHELTQEQKVQLITSLYNKNKENTFRYRSESEGGIVEARFHSDFDFFLGNALTGKIALERQIGDDLYDKVLQVSDFVVHNGDMNLEVNFISL